jgi:chaperonin GroES
VTRPSWTRLHAIDTKGFLVIRAWDNRPMRAAPKPKSRTRRTPKQEVRLTGDRIVVESPDDGERKTRGGLLIPATAQPAPKRCVWGEVALVGPDVRAVRAGDKILYLPQAGLEVELDGREYLLLRERDVQAVASPSDGKPHPGQYL